MTTQLQPFNLLALRWNLKAVNIFNERGNLIVKRVDCRRGSGLASVYDNEDTKWFQEQLAWLIKSSGLNSVVVVDYISKRILTPSQAFVDRYAKSCTLWTFSVIPEDQLITRCQEVLNIYCEYYQSLMGLRK